jgi:predicted phosphodiesterase
MLRTLLLIGDVHTEATRLTHVLAHATRTQPDLVMCVGDIVDGPEDAGRCIELLRDHQVATVRGNHERWLLAGNPLEPFDGEPWMHDWLAALPPTRSFDTVAGRLLLGHGIGHHDMSRLRPDDDNATLQWNDALWQLLASRSTDIYVGGHTHERMARRFNDLLILNPGTLARSTSRPGKAVGSGWMSTALSSTAASPCATCGARQVSPCRPDPGTLI